MDIDADAASTVGIVAPIVVVLNAVAVLLRTIEAAPATFRVGVAVAVAEITNRAAASALRETDAVAEAERLSTGAALRIEFRVAVAEDPTTSV